MGVAEFLAKARAGGFQFLFLSDDELLVAKTSDYPLNERIGFYAACVIESHAFWGFLGVALSKRVPIRWEGEQ